MTIGSASNSPADCSIETETVGGGGTAPSWIGSRRNTIFQGRHDRRPAPVANSARSQKTLAEGSAALAAMRTALKLRAGPTAQSRKRPRRQ